MVDIRAELEKKILESNQRATSLSDRLNQLDQFNSQTAIPQISSQGPKGYNPMNSLNALFQTISNRKAVAGDVQSERDAGLNYLTQLANYDKSNTTSQKDFFDEIKAAKEVGYDYDPETGEYKKAGNEEASEVLDLVWDIKNDNLKPLTGFLRLRSGIKGTKAYDTKQKIQQLVDKLALKARAAIKGTGTISDIEQKMLKNAQTLLQPGLSEEQFRAELSKLENNAMKSLGGVSGEGGDDPLGIL